MTRALLVLACEEACRRADEAQAAVLYEAGTWANYRHLLGVEEMEGRLMAAVAWLQREEARSRRLIMALERRSGVEQVHA